MIDRHFRSYFDYHRKPHSISTLVLLCSLLAARPVRLLHSSGKPY
jgi:hypothetical protein